MGFEGFMQVLNETELFGASLAELLGKVVLVLVVWIVAMAIQHVLVRLVSKALRAAEVPSSSIVINIVRSLIWFLALITILEPVFGVQPTAFVAALGIGSVALSLGMQDTMSNIVGGLTLMLSKVIEPGDVIKVGDFTGTVTDIGWRSTCVSDSYGQINVIPNSVLSKTALVKLSSLMRTRCQVSVVIKHDSSLEEVRADVARVAQEALGERLDAKMGVDVIVSGFDAAGIQATVEAHLTRKAIPDEARTLLAEHLIDRPWAARLS